MLQEAIVPGKWSKIKAGKSNIKQKGSEQMRMK